MTRRQMALDLALQPQFARADFLVADANTAALAAIERFPETAGATRGVALALVGPEGSGKTHLAHIWQERVGAAFLAVDDLVAAVERQAAADRPAKMVLDDAQAIAGDAAAERALFHLINLNREQGGALLLAAREAPARWGVKLPDLASRLAALPTATIGAPDDALLSAVLVKLFADRQVAVGEEVIGFLLGRMERSLSAARSIVAQLDALALEGKRAITVPLAAQVMQYDMDLGR
jgi:DnaA regulatory inactivator Hda